MTDRNDGLVYNDKIVTDYAKSLIEGRTDYSSLFGSNNAESVMKGILTFLVLEIPNFEKQSFIEDVSTNTTRILSLKYFLFVDFIHHLNLYGLHRGLRPSDLVSAERRTESLNMLFSVSGLTLNAGYTASGHRPHELLVLSTKPLNQRKFEDFSTKIYPQLISHATKKTPTKN